MQDTDQIAVVKLIRAFERVGRALESVFGALGRLTGAVTDLVTEAMNYALVARVRTSRSEALLKPDGSNDPRHRHRPSP